MPNIQAHAAFARCRGVTFHDGTPWNAQACKANFDNVFVKGLLPYHGWYDLPLRVKSWQVRAKGGTLSVCICCGTSHSSATDSRGSCHHYPPYYCSLVAIPTTAIISAHQQALPTC